VERKIRFIAAYSAVGVFFAISLAGSFIQNYTPATCAKRAVIGALIAYFAVLLAVKAAVAVIMKELVKQKMAKMEKDKEKFKLD
jgi:polyferredoxin